MSSPTTPFEYDVFISYRHNDNRNGWVSEFVQALQQELVSVFKEPVRVYFDKNPHDGILESHNVDKTVEGKLNCLIFMPIVSQTYCDSRSFAWQYEFRAFNKAAKEDALGSEVRLANGNVANRILPINIHDLDAADKESIENEIGIVLRPIDFVYREPGVNRPLTPADSRADNLNRIDYRNQVNKTANAIKEIIQGVKKPVTAVKPPAYAPQFVDNRKSILVLPFVNISNDPDQEYFSDGLTDEMITVLSQFNELLVISRSSAMTFKGTKKTITEIARDTNVRYFLEGSVRKAGNAVRISAQLIDSETDSSIWSARYDGTLDDIFGMQEKVSRSILGALQLKLRKKDSDTITNRPIDSTKAYELYLKSQYEFYSFKEENLLRAVDYLEAALVMTGDNTFLLATLGTIYVNLFNIAATAQNSYLENAKALANKVAQINPNAAETHALLGFIGFFGGHNDAIVMHLQKAHEANPNDAITSLLLALGYFYRGSADEAEAVLVRLDRVDPFNPLQRTVMALAMLTRGNYASALSWSKAGYQRNPEVPQAQLYYAYCLACNNQRQESCALLDRLINDTLGTVFQPLAMFLKLALQGKRKEACNIITDEFRQKLRRDFEFSWLIADGYALIDELDEAIGWCEHIISMGFINFPLLAKHDLFLENLRSDLRFKALMRKIER